tara:strand:+ start:268 stop:516 length:249 start_codon:yes stop_codon:yes gene_type:complete
MPPATKQVELQVEIVKQHPGPQQVERSVVVDVPGKHFPQLQTAEQKIAYPAAAACQLAMEAAASVATAAAATPEAASPQATA